MIHYEYRKPKEADVVRPAPPGDHRSQFERIRRQTPEGLEYWSGRDLAGVLGYTRYRQFETVVERATSACANSGNAPTEHFIDATSPGGRNVHLTRYACYLIIQNSSPRKPAVAQGQTYFAAQTRRQEVAEKAMSLEDQRRLMLRQEVAAHNKKLASAAKAAGVVETDDFRAFQNEGYKGLYGGLTAGRLRHYRGLDEQANVLDYMGSTELAANLFRATQTEEKLRRDHVQTKEDAMALHHQVGRRVRQAMGEISGVMPEQLPVGENINMVKRRLKKLQAS